MQGLREGQQLFGRFRLLEYLGRGGMGAVWRAHDEKLDRELALKFLLADAQGSPETIAELKSETRRALALTHPAIVRVYDFLDSADAACICMELVRGRTLAQAKLEKPGGHFEVSEIAAWLPQLLDALTYAHEEARTIHRDLKPANLMLTESGRIKVTDLGISCTMYDSLARISMRHHSSASPPWASPQQLAGMTPAPQDDVYALGATLYDLVTGKPPFFRGNIFGQVENAVPPRMSDGRRELGATGEPIPEAWEETVAACLAKNPADRPQTMRELGRRLDGATAETVRTPPPPPAPRSATPIAAPARRGTSAIAVIAVTVVVLGVVALAAVFASRSSGKKQAGASTPLPSPAPAASTSEPENRLARLIDEGLTARERNEDEIALARFREAAGMAPENPAPIAQLALTYEKLGEIDRAVAQWKSIQQLGEAAGVYAGLAQRHLAKAPAPAPVAVDLPGAAPAASVDFLAGVQASSTLEPQQDSRAKLNTYSAGNVIDGREHSAWVAARGSRNPQLTFTFKQPVLLSGITVLPGYAKDLATFRKNNRPKDLTVILPDGARTTIRCQDKMQPQPFDLPNPAICGSVTLVVTSVWDEKAKFDDTAISEVSFR